MGGRAREAGSRAKPGNQLVVYIRNAFFGKSDTPPQCHVTRVHTRVIT